MKMNAFFAVLYAVAVAVVLAWLFESKRRAGNVTMRAARAEEAMAEAVLSVMHERLSNPARLAAVRDVNVDQTIKLDGFATFVATEMRASSAFLHVLDAEHQIACSYFGSSPGQTDGPVKHSYCAFVVGIQGPIAIEDAKHHPLSEAVHPYPLGLQGLDVGAYLGVPVKCDSEVVGALCVIDRRTRAWTKIEIAQMEMLAVEAEELICAPRK